MMFVPRGRTSRKTGFYEQKIHNIHAIAIMRCIYLFFYLSNYNILNLSLCGPIVSHAHYNRYFKQNCASPVTQIKVKRKLVDKLVDIVSFNITVMCLLFEKGQIVSKFPRGCTRYTEFYCIILKAVSCLTDKTRKLHCHFQLTSANCVPAWTEVLGPPRR